MIRFYNGKILTFDGGTRVTDGEVWTDGDSISYVGAARTDLPAFEREIDLDGDVVMPGFKNAHTHTAMTAFRSYADDMELHTWLNKRIWPYERRLTEEGVYYFTKLGIMEYLSSGITACFDMYGHTDSIVKACVDSGFRIVFCSAMNDFDADHTQIERDYLKNNAISPLVSYRLGIHAEYTTGMERLEYMRSLGEKYKAPLYLHMSETKTEVDGCISRTGMSPVRYLDKLGFFRYGGGAFHCVWMDDEDIEIMVRNRVYAITCPASNLKLASGIAPIDRMAAAGVEMGIGTDGAGSNNALDMFREMYLVSTLQKYLNMDATAGCADRTLRMACVGGAHAMGLDSCDELAVGKKADIVVIDMKQPNMQPPHNIAKNIVYSGSKSNVRLTMVNGRILYENGRFNIGEDACAVYEKAGELSRRLFSE